MIPTQLSARIYAIGGLLLILWYILLTPRSTFLTSASAAVRAEKRGNSYFIVHTGGTHYGK